MKYIKCDVCGKYDEPSEHNFKNIQFRYVPDLCSNCIDDKTQEKISYDAFECGYTNIDEFLNDTKIKYY